MAFDAAFWATIALFVFIGVVIYLKLPGQITKMLDSRIAKIQDDLDEAKRLREEAQALLADYERRRKEAESEAQDIVTAAQEEAARLAEEAKVSVEDLITRRTKAVEEKIAQAEQQALGEVRARSADVAIEAARILLTDQMKDNSGELVDQAIKDVAAKLN